MLNHLTWFARLLKLMHSMLCGDEGIAMRFGGLIIAMILAAVAAVVVLRSSAAPESTPAQPIEAAKSVNVYVAAKEISVGTKIAADMVAVQPWPEKLVLDGFVRADAGADAIVGTVARGTFQAQEPIVSSKLANANDPNFLAGELPKGMRVVAIATNEVDGVAGFVFPGDHVDVLMTHDVEVSEATNDGLGGAPTMEKQTKHITETLLVNAKVVAVDQRSSAAGATDKEGKLIIPKSVSLMVTLEDAQRLRLGAKEGVLTLALRSLADRESADALRLTQFGDISQFQGVGGTGDGVRVLRGAPVSNKEVTSDFVNALRAAALTNSQATPSATPRLEQK